MINNIQYYLGLSKNGFHNLSYRDWGIPAHPHSTVICAHGLTRNGADFNFLARQLKDSFHVICPDIVGRGNSDWLKDASLYNYSQYMSDMTSLFSRLNVPNLATGIDWIGTSMGGILGMLIATQPRSPVRRLILNDIGPWIPIQALLRIQNYMEVYPSFASLGEAKKFIKQTFASFGNLTNEQWDHLAVSSIKKDVDTDTFKMAYDPELITAYKLALQDKAKIENGLWDIWQKIQCPILLLRGTQSDVLEVKTVIEMKSWQPKMEIIEFESVGHAPALMDSEQIEAIKTWLMR